MNTVRDTANVMIRVDEGKFDPISIYGKQGLPALVSEPIFWDDKNDILTLC